jgi:hypothetical protein
MKVTDDQKRAWRLTKQCSDCKSTIEIEASDVYTQRLGSFDEFETYYLVDCGACGSQIKLSGLPNFVKRGAKPR